MGKEKIEEKDVRLLRYAVEQAFDGAMRDGALTLLNRLVDSASEAANLEEELLNLKREYQRSMENSKRGTFTPSGCLQAQMQAREANGEGADALRRRQAGHVRRDPLRRGRTRLVDCRDCRSVVV